MKHKLLCCVPPGQSASKELKGYLVGLLFAICISTRFLIHYQNAYQHLFVTIRGVEQIRKDAVMPSFEDLLHHSFAGFAILVICLLVLVVWHYHSFRRGSMSIYLMRRLPNRSLIHRQCWTFPLVGIILTLAIASALYLVFHFIYLNCTPVQCLPVTLGREFL